MTDTAKRWENYRKANSNRPSARENELRRAYELINPQQGEKILEVGTGNGFLTFPLADAVGKTGEIVSADVTEENIQDVEHANAQRGFNIKTVLFDDQDDAPFSKEYSNYFDAVVSIATLHHFDNRDKYTGVSGRTRAVTEFYKTLRGGGRLVVADPVFGTITQKYFYAINNPKYCYPDGHPHDFFTLEELRTLVSQIGFMEVDVFTQYVPWQFDTEEAAKDFVHTIHNAQCTEEESFAVAKDALGFKKVGTHYELGWELFFLTAKK